MSLYGAATSSDEYEDAHMICNMSKEVVEAHFGITFTDFEVPPVFPLSLSFL